MTYLFQLIEIKELVDYSVLSTVTGFLKTILEKSSLMN